MVHITNIVSRHWFYMRFKVATVSPRRHRVRSMKTQYYMWHTLYIVHTGQRGLTAITAVRI
jgi:hypothetical protein